MRCSHVKSSEVTRLTLVPCFGVKGAFKVYITGSVAHGKYRRVSVVPVRHVIPVHGLRYNRECQHERRDKHARSKMCTWEPRVVHGLGA